MASVFTKIIEGSLPSYRVYEDAHCVAFLSIDPITLGHTLVVPKKEIDSFIDVSEPEYSAVFKAAQIIGRAIQSATTCKRVGMAVQGFEVAHFHLHLIPLNSPEEFDFKRASRKPEEEMRAMEEIIKARIKTPV